MGADPWWIALGAVAVAVLGVAGWRLLMGRGAGEARAITRRAGELVVRCQRIEQLEAQLRSALGGLREAPAHWKASEADLLDDIRTMTVEVHERWSGAAQATTWARDLMPAARVNILTQLDSDLATTQKVLASLERRVDALRGSSGD